MEKPASSGMWGQLMQIDTTLSARWAVHNGPLRLLALLVAHSGDSPLWVAVAAAIFVWGNVSWYPLALRLLAGTVVGAAVAAALKFLFRRSRPVGPYAALYAKIDRHAFPSGHATRAGCVVIVLAPLLPVWATALLAVWAVLIAVARVALQVHYLLDVTVGLVLGSLVGGILLVTVF